MADAVLCRSAQETKALAEKTGASLRGGEVILLHGELGSGKTTFVQGLAKGLSIDDPNGVSSPSYTLINVYEGPIRLVHVDLYRLGSPEEVTDLALDEFLDDQTVLAIEWGERLPDELSRELIEVTFEYEDESTRRITIQP